MARPFANGSGEGHTLHDLDAVSHYWKEAYGIPRDDRRRGGAMPKCGNGRDFQQERRPATPMRRQARAARSSPTPNRSIGARGVMTRVLEDRFPTVPVILLLIGCVVVGWFMGRSMTRPLRTLGNRG